MKHFRIALVALIFFPSIAMAKNFAILVGVSDYPELPEKLWLDGPRNDVALMRLVLEQNGFEGADMEVLVDGGEVLPTRENITAAFEGVAAQVRADDFVYVHFSGHGSQQPAVIADSEPDGLDEIFLPRNVMTWNRERGEVPNSLNDNDIGELLGSMRDKGADVWAVFDTCHSGTMTRSIGSESLKFRNVSPEALNIPVPRNQESKVVAEQRFTIDLDESDSRGDLVAFYAAQSTEQAPEMNLESGDEDLPYGLFTHTLASLIGRNPSASYRQLAQLILSSYNSRPWHRATPEFEGAGDRSIFHREGSIKSRYAIIKAESSYSIKAGQLEGFGAGAYVSVFESPISSETIATLYVTGSTLTSSAGRIEAGAIEKSVAYGEIEQPPLPLPVRLKWIGEATEFWLSESQQINTRPGYLEKRVLWVGSDQDADIMIAASDDELYFFTADSEVPCELMDPVPGTPCAAGSTSVRKVQLPPSPKDGAQVFYTSISRAVRAINLLRISTSMGVESELRVDTLLQYPDSDVQIPLDVTEVPSLEAGTKLYLNISNNGKSALDVAMFFVDSNFGISQIDPNPSNAGSERLFPGEKKQIDGSVNSATVGMEQILLITRPVSRDGPSFDLRHIIQGAMQSGAVRARNFASTDIFAQALGSAPPSRDFTINAKSPSESSVQLIRWRTMQ